MKVQEIWVNMTFGLLQLPQLGLELVTTDQDFKHLDKTFVNLRLINPLEIQKLY
jgi:hypothetical protein